MSCICLWPHNRSKEVCAGATCIHKGHNSRWQCGCSLVQPRLSVPQSAWTETGQLCVQCGAAYWLWVLSQLGWPGNLSSLNSIAYLWRFSIGVRKLSQSFLKLILATILAIASGFILVITKLILSYLFKWVGKFLVTLKNLYNFKNRFKNASSI